MLTWLPLYLVSERGFSIVGMAWIATIAYMVNALSAFIAGWAIDRFLARGGSANVGYKSVMAVAHLGSVACMLAMAMGSPKVALGACSLSGALRGLLARRICHVRDPGRAARIGAMGGHSKLPRQLAGDHRTRLTGYIVETTGHYTNAFVVAAAVSVLGLVGWIWMVPKLAELGWQHTPQPSAAGA